MPSKKKNKILKTAKDEAQYLLDEAKRQSAQIIESAEKRGNNVIDEAKSIATQEKERIIEAAKSEVQSFALKHGVSIEAGKIVLVAHFLPEHREAGSSLLIYFSTILKQVHSDIEANVSLEQFGESTRLVVSIPEEKISEVESTLVDYGCILTGKTTPKELLNNHEHLLMLQNKLDMASQEVRLTKKLLKLSSKQNKTLENNIDFLQESLKDSFATIDCNLVLLKKIIKKNSENTSIAKALNIIEGALSSPQLMSKREEVEEAVQKLSINDPNALKELYDFLKSASSGATGNIVATWITPFLAFLPKG